MGYQDRRYDEPDQGGGFRRLFSRFSANDFFSWSLPLLTVPRWFPGIGGIHVRVHLLYVIVLVTELLKALDKDALRISYIAAMMVTLFVLVLLHEFGHCLACRAVKGEADEVLMWPLGGLAYCRPPMRWQSMLVTTLGGPGVNVVLLPILGGALIAAGASWGDVLLNPLHPTHGLSLWIFGPAWRYWLWSAHYMNFVLLAFNMLVPMFPMDCGRVMQELLWWRLGYKRSMEISVTVGFVVAVLLGVAGIATSELRLTSVALFGGVICWNEKRRLQATPPDEPWSYDTDKGYQGFGADADPGKTSRAERKRQEKDEHDKAELDRILDKIRNSGMSSLSRGEKAFLAETTERTRSRR